MPPRPKRPSISKSLPTPIPPTLLPTPSLTSPALLKSYRIGRGEQGVLTFEPYKSHLLPHWRFRTVPIAEQSAATLNQCFNHYLERGDFVGADMSRKFIQMGMTRAKRYANYKGGRKYDHVKGEKGEDGEEGAKGGRVQRGKSEGHAGKEEKARASEVFEEVWRRCLVDEKYLALKKEFVKEVKEWEKEEKRGTKKGKKNEEDGEETVKDEEGT